MFGHFPKLFRTHTSVQRHSSTVALSKILWCACAVLCSLGLLSLESQAHPQQSNSSFRAFPKTYQGHVGNLKRRLARRRRRSKLPSKPIHLNTATARQLVRLPRIGKSKAKQIIELRTQLGGSFRSLRQLRSIRGIGKRTLEKLRPYVTLGKGQSGSIQPTEPPPAIRHRKRRRRRRSRRKRRKRRKKRRKRRRKRRKKRSRRKKRRKKRRSRRKKKRSWRGSWKRRSRSDSYDRDSDLDGDASLRERPSGRRSAPKRHTRRPVAPYRRHEPVVAPSNNSASVGEYKHRSRRRIRKGRKKRKNCYQRWLTKNNTYKTPVNVNIASLRQLQTLPCIGKKRAMAIISMRISGGPFRTIRELRKVSGIGKKTLAWLQPHIRIRLNINKATLAQLEALKPLSGGLGQAIYRDRKRRGLFRKVRSILRVRGIGRGTYEQIKKYLSVTSKAPPLPVQKHRTTRHKPSRIRIRPIPRTQEWTAPKKRKRPPQHRTQVIKID